MSSKELVLGLERLNDKGLAQFVEMLQKHGELAEALCDLLAFRMRADEPSRPFEEFSHELDSKTALD